MMAAQDTPLKRNPIGIVAGGGVLPDELAKALLKNNTPFFVAAIKDETTASFDPAVSSQFTWGEIGKILKYFKTHNCSELVLLGQITRRPEFSSIIGDAGTMRLLPKIVTAMTGGDDSLLLSLIHI